MHVAATFFILIVVAASGTGRGDGSGKSAPARPTKAKVVDTPEMKAKPKPPERTDVFYAHPEHGELVEVRRAPTKAAPVFAHFAGGADLDVHGQPVERDGVVWVEVDFLGVRGWVPKDRISAEATEDTWDKRWDIRFISPSGKVVVEYQNHGIGDVSVRKDGRSRESYGLDLGSERHWCVSGMVLFSKDENCLALSYGGPSYGTDVFIYGRDAKGQFKHLKLNLQERCWQTALANGRIPKGASPAHLYVAEQEPTDHGFVIRFVGDYTGLGAGHTNFGPLRFIWTRQGNKLELVK